jgi:hypothetical protein
MAEIPELKTTVKAVYEALEEHGAKEGPRLHLGASEIGKSCTRQLWYKFRWALQERLEGRIVSLFRRGQHEETWFTEDLRRAGIMVIDKTPAGEQFRFEKFGGHFGGSMDAVGNHIPECENPEKWHVLEEKTMNLKGFTKLKKEGVEKAKPEHYVQMQMYMGMSGKTNEERMTRAMYLVRCKDNDELYAERVKYVDAVYKKHLKRAEEIIFSEEPPLGVSTDPTWYECKYCLFQAHCHGQALPDPTCRSCAHVTAEPDGTWTCGQNGEVRSPELQLTGCADHVYNPNMVPEKLGVKINASDTENWVEYKMDDGRTFKNGSRSILVYTSAELRYLDPALIGDKSVESLRADFGASVVPLEPPPEPFYSDDIPF